MFRINAFKEMNAAPRWGRGVDRELRHKLVDYKASLQVT